MAPEGGMIAADMPIGDPTGGKTAAAAAATSSLFPPAPPPESYKPKADDRLLDESISLKRESVPWTLGSGAVSDRGRLHVKQFSFRTTRGMKHEYRGMANEDRLFVCANVELKEHLEKKYQHHITAEADHSPSQPEDPISLFGVMDGHGGHTCAEFVRVNVVETFRDTLPPRDRYADRSNWLAKGLYNTIKRLEDDWSAYAMQHKDWSGTCVLIAAQKGGDIAIASVGDCRAIFHDDTTGTLSLCAGHNCRNPDEVKRIEDAGGFVARNRVCGSLEPTRTVGDMDVKMRYPGTVTAEPRLWTFKLTGGDSDEIERAAKATTMAAEGGGEGGNDGMVDDNAVDVDVDGFDKDSTADKMLREVEVTDAGAGAIDRDGDVTVIATPLQIASQSLQDLSHMEGGSGGWQMGGVELLTTTIGAAAAVEGGQGEGEDEDDDDRHFKPLSRADTMTKISKPTKPTTFVGPIDMEMEEEEEERGEDDESRTSLQTSACLTEPLSVVSSAEMNSYIGSGGGSGGGAGSSSASGVESRSSINSIGSIPEGEEVNMGLQGNEVVAVKTAGGGGGDDEDDKDYARRLALHLLTRGNVAAQHDNAAPSSIISTTTSSDSDVSTTPAAAVVCGDGTTTTCSNSIVDITHHDGGNACNVGGDSDDGGGSRPRQNSQGGKSTQSRQSTDDFVMDIIGAIDANVPKMAVNYHHGAVGAAAGKGMDTSPALSAARNARSGSGSSLAEGSGGGAGRGVFSSGGSGGGCETPSGTIRGSSMDGANVLKSKLGRLFGLRKSNSSSSGGGGSNDKFGLSRSLSRSGRGRIVGGGGGARRHDRSASAPTLNTEGGGIPRSASNPSLFSFGTTFITPSPSTSFQPHSHATPTTTTTRSTTPTPPPGQLPGKEGVQGTGGGGGGGGGGGSGGLDGIERELSLSGRFQRGSTRLLSKLSMPAKATKTSGSESHIQAERPHAGGFVLLCTDGVLEVLSTEGIIEHVKSQVVKAKKLMSGQAEEHQQQARSAGGGGGGGGGSRSGSMSRMEKRRKNMDRENANVAASLVNRVIRMGARDDVTAIVAIFGERTVPTEAR